MPNNPIINALEKYAQTQTVHFAREKSTEFVNGGYKKVNKPQIIVGAIILLLILAIFIGYFVLKNDADTPSQQPITVQPVTSPPKQAINPSNNPNLYPNPTLTPGDTLPATAKEICVPGYAGQTRNVSQLEKKQVYKEYNLTYPQPAGSIEVDHLISLQLGGSNDIKNLWPEKADPRPGFHEKDAVENYLHKQLCDGKMTLEQVQTDIRTDWYKVYEQMIGNKPNTQNTNVEDGETP